MRQIQQNSFEGGLNLDSPPELIKNNEYVDAQNFRIAGFDENLSVSFRDGTNSQFGNKFKLVNSKGTTQYFTFPNLNAYSYCSIEIPYKANAISFIIINFSINGTSQTPATILTTNSYNQLISFINTHPVLSIYYRASGNIIDESVAIPFPQLLSYGFIIIKPTNTAIVGANTCVIDGITFGGSTVSITNMSAVNSFKIVGSQWNANDFVFFTVANSATYPNDLNPNQSQAWYIPVKEFDSNPVFDVNNLKYNGNLNLSQRYQTRIELVRESENILKALWVDDYNSPRQLLIGPEIVFSSPKLINFIPESKNPIIKVQGTIPGTLPIGVYNYTVRLISSDGKISGPFPLTNNFIVTNPSLNDSQNVGVSSNIGHSLLISNIDINYSIIEVIGIYSDSQLNNPNTAFIISSVSISGNTMVFSHTNNSSSTSVSTVSINDFNLYNILSFKKAADISIDDNRTILANVSQNKQLVVSKSEINSYTKTAITKPIAVDSFFGTNLAVTPPTSGPAPYYIGFPSATTGSPSDQPSLAVPPPVPPPYSPPPDVTLNNEFGGYKSRSINNQLVGYMRGETYRFGIVLYYKDGSTGLVDYLFDYTFPNQYDSGYAISNSTFPGIVFALGLQLGNINMNAYKDKIKGFSIVRAKRIGGALGQVGYIRHTTSSTGGGEFELAFCGPDTDFNFSTPAGSLFFKILGGYASKTTVPVSDIRYLIDYKSPSSFGAAYTNGRIFQGTISQIQSKAGAATSSDKCFIRALSGNVSSNPVPPEVFPLQPIIYNGAASDSMQIFNVYSSLSNTYPDLASTQYFSTGHYQPVDTSNSGDTPGSYIYTATVFGGDTYVNMYSRLVNFAAAFPSTTITRRHVIFPVESSINPSLRYSNNILNQDGTYTFNDVMYDDGSDYYFRNTSGSPAVYKTEGFNYNTVFNRSQNTNVFVARPINYSSLDSNTFPYRIWASEKQVYGSPVSAYTRTSVNDFVDVNPVNGPITAISNLTADDVKTLYFWQKTAFGKLPVRPYQIKLGNDANATFSTGQLFGEFNYISRDTGSIHKFSIIRGKNNLYWFDGNTRQLMKFGPNGLTNFGQVGKCQYYIKNNTVGISTLDNPLFLGGIHGVYDDIRDEVTYTFKMNPDINTVAQSQDRIPSQLVGKKEWTIVYSEPFNTFVSFMSYKPGLYLRMPGARILSQEPNSSNNAVYLFDSNSLVRNRFFSSSNQEISYVEYILSQDGKLAKNPSNVYIDSNQSPDGISAHTYQQSNVGNQSFLLRGALDFTQPSLKWLVQARNSKWLIPFPNATDLNNGSSWQNNITLIRMEGEQFFVKIVFSASDYREVQSIETIYTKSLRNI